MRILVVGGGIGGMATAIALEQAGFDPLVLEQAPELTESGAGLGLHANAMRVLTALGAADHVRQCGVRVDTAEWRRMADGRTIFTHDYRPMADHFGYGFIGMRRFDLLQALAQRVPSERVRLNAQLVGIDERADGVVARLADGDEVHGDILVGADGLRSTVRAILFGEQEPRFTGGAMWRGTIPMDRVPAEYARKIVLWPGHGRHCMTYPIRSDLQAFVGFVPTSEILREDWSLSGELEDLHASFRGATPEVLTIVDGITTALISPIKFRDPLPIWGTDRVILLGDAAHPAPPSAAQGAAQALEDAVTLAVCLKRDAPPAALADFAARRQARTAGMLLSARNNFEMVNEPDPVQQDARDGRFKGLLRLDPVGETMFGWLYGHDAAAAAEKPRPAPPTSEVMRRPEARLAYEAWSRALTFEDRARLWIGEREGYARFLAATFPPQDGVVAEPIDADGVAALRVTPPGGPADAGVVVLHLHGGGYTMGSARGATDLAARLATAVGGWALVPDYRLAPEHAYPAALDDAVAAHGWLARAHPAARIVVSGEGAGGGLAIALAVRLRGAGLPPPAALHVVSPFCDLTVSSPSATTMPSPDPWLNRDRLRMLAASYLHGADPEAPLVSPVRADLTGLPPLLIQAAAGEALADDARRLAEAAEAAGVAVTLELVDDTVHAFVLFDTLPETRAALASLSAHVRRVVREGEGPCS